MDSDEIEPVLGRRVRAFTLELAPGLRVTALEAADADALIEAALERGGDAYAGIVWPSAIAVARAVAREARPGEHVLDLGAGTGLCALAAARVGARATALDHDTFALALVAAAARLQALEIDTLHFDLGATDALPPADLAVLADVLYEPALAETAARRVVEVVGRGGRALVGDPGRLARADFLRVLARHGLVPEFREVRVHVPGEALAATVGVARIAG